MFVSKASLDQPKINLMRLIQLPSGRCAAGHQISSHWRQLCWSTSLRLQAVCQASASSAKLATFTSPGAAVWRGRVLRSYCLSAAISHWLASSIEQDFVTELWAGVLAQFLHEVVKSFFVFRAQNICHICPYVFSRSITVTENAMTMKC